MTTLFNTCLIIYILALLFAVIRWMTGRRLAGTVVVALLTIGALLQTVYLGWRWMEAGRPPFSNMFESLALLALTSVVIYLGIRARIQIPMLDTAASLAAVLLLVYASAFESEIAPLVPALRSNWLTFHVCACMVAYGAFTITFFSAIGYLVAARTGSRIAPTTRDAFEIVTDKAISLGFLFLTIGVITGAVWANVAWGTYWSWDPKETWSLITWFAYAIYLHCSFMLGWRGKRAAWIAIVSYICVIITYIGVNFLMKGLHSYA